ncbi:LD-carboxypeptidase [Myxococcota bacterium]|nr:LD-carboxypeptidase [Myxococcota bacterium]
MPPLPAPPPLLFPGARIGVFAPSGVFNPERLQAGWDLAEAWGLELVPSPNLGQRHRFLAGDDEARLADLRWALTDPSLDGAWMARGGYGLGRLLSKVDWSTIQPRPVIGFSDGTALHSALWGHARLLGVHGPVLHSLAVSDAPSQGRLRSLLMEGATTRWEGEVWVEGEAEGPLVGGNLCVLATLCGTPHQLNARGAILALEDIAEPAYKLDRMLNQLREAGVLAGVRAVVLGEFFQCLAPPDADWTVQDVLREALAPLGVPVLAGLPFGHGAHNEAFYFGGHARLSGGGLSLSGADAARAEAAR